MSVRRSGPTRLRRAPLAAIAAMAALLSVGAASAPVAATSYGPAVGCPPAIVTLQSLISLGAYFDGPLVAREGAPALNEGAVGCFGDTELTFVAFRGSPEGLGGAYSYAVEPAWLDTWQQASRFLMTTDAEDQPRVFAGSFLAVAVPPDLQARFDGSTGTWVAVHGHFDDAAARTCRLKGDPVTNAGEIPTPADLVAMCRTTFVVKAIDRVARPCPTGAIDWAAISATPENLRAQCFGSIRLAFTATGFSIANTWHLTMPAVRDWELLDPSGGSDEAAERAKAIEAFVPEAVAVPNPSDAPWHDSDGVGGFDVRWRVEGHFDDPLAAACRPDPESFLLDDRLVVWEEQDAHEFCRNHLFVDSLEWIRPAAPSARPADTTSASPVSASPSSSAPSPLASGAAPAAPATPSSAQGGPVLVIAAAVVGLLLLAGLRGRMRP